MWPLYLTKKIVMESMLKVLYLVLAYITKVLPVGRGGGGVNIT